jgi:hypothetical protein
MSAARWTPEAILAKIPIFVLPSEEVGGTPGAWFVGSKDGRGREFPTRDAAEVFAYGLVAEAVAKLESEGVKL